MPLREEQASQILGLEYLGAEADEAQMGFDGVAEYASARLFLQTARRARTGFELAPTMSLPWPTSAAC